MKILNSDDSDDQVFFLNIYKQFKRIMFYTVRKYVSDNAVVEDLVQDAIMKLIPKISTMRKLSRSALSAYIVITVRNISVNYLRHQRIVDMRCADSDFDEELDAEYQRHSPSAEEIILVKEKIGEFYKEFNKLSNKDRDVLLGKYVLGLTDKELAGMYGCKPDSIRMMLTRARRNALGTMKEVFKYDEA
jgi:RNA polymerase sigma-70 factor (ECF subfamily)